MPCGRRPTTARLELGIIPPGTPLTPRPAQIPAWADYDDRYKPVAARLMEVYAGFLAHTDAQVGRLINALDELGQLDNTLFIYLMRRQRRLGGGHPPRRLERPGLPERVPRGPRVAAGPHRRLRHRPLREPLQRRLGLGARRAVPVDEAGGLALRRHPQRPGHLVAERHRGPRRAAHASSITSSTSRRRSSTPPASSSPTHVNGVEQTPIEGVSMRYCFDDADAPSTRTHPVLRDVRQPGDLPRRLDRLLLPRPSCPGCAARRVPFGDDRDAGSSTTSPTTSARRVDLAEQFPDKLAELQALFEPRAEPTTSIRSATRRSSARCPINRPSLLEGRPRSPTYADNVRMPELATVQLQEHLIRPARAPGDPAGGAQGVVICQGGSMAGWTLYVARRRAASTSTTTSATTSPRRLPSNRCRRARWRWACRSTTTAADWGKGGTVTPQRRRRPQWRAAGSSRPSRSSSP